MKHSDIDAETGNAPQVGKGLFGTNPNRRQPPPLPGTLFQAVTEHTSDEPAIWEVEYILPDRGVACKVVAVRNYEDTKWVAPEQYAVKAEFTESLVLGILKEDGPIPKPLPPDWPRS
jgi:hypothetical protein